MLLMLPHRRLSGKGVDYTTYLLYRVIGHSKVYIHQLQDINGLVVHILEDYGYKKENLHCTSIAEVLILVITIS